MIMKQMMIENFAAQGLQLEIDEDRKVASCVRFSARAKFGYKIVFNYRFAYVERLYEYCAKYINDKIAAQEFRAARKLKVKAEAAEKAAAVKIGDIFIDSWGYEQTNVDFYQVVAKPSAKTVIVREIACRSEDGSQMSHGMADNVFPVRDAFIGSEMKKRIDNYGGFKTSSYSSARPADENRSYYRSWYA